MQETDIKREVARPLDDMKRPTSFTRFASVVFDIALFIITAIIAMVVSTLVVTKTGNYQKYSNLQNEHIISSHLANEVEGRGLLKFEEDEYFLEEDDGYLLVNHLSYFYLNYMSNKNIKDGEVGSLDPVETYDVAWFNENVLDIETDVFFVYQKTGDEIDKTKIGTVAPDFIVEEEVGGETVKKVSLTSDLAKFMNTKYSEAMKEFYNQKSMKQAISYMNTVSSLLIFFPALFSLLIYYVLIPIFNPFGRTLGKMVFKLSLVNDSGYLIKKYQVLLRIIPLLGIIAFISFINVLYLQIIVIVLLALISLSTMVFTRNKQTLSDFISRCIVIKSDGVTVYKNEEDYLKVLNVLESMKKNDKQ